MKVFSYLQNSEVLEYFTIANLLLNIQNEEINKDRFDFYYGDWESFGDCLKSKPAAFGNGLFDVILTSETIYNPESQRKLIKVFSSCLKPEGFVYPFRVDRLSCNFELLCSIVAQYTSIIYSYNCNQSITIESIFYISIYGVLCAG